MGREKILAWKQKEERKLEKIDKEGRQIPTSYKYMINPFYAHYEQKGRTYLSSY